MDMMGLEEKLKVITMTVEMDRKNTIDSFEEFGMADPFLTRKTFDDALSNVKCIDFYTEVYGPYTKDIIQALKSG
jgi:hypothetical protein